MFKILKYSKFKESITEGVIIVKRKYTEAYPQVNKNLSAEIRNYILKAVSDKVLSKDELLDIIGMSRSKNILGWLSQNREYFSIVKGDTKTEFFKLSQKAILLLQKIK